jgi:hypothetical protein
MEHKDSQIMQFLIAIILLLISYRINLFLS